MIVVYECEGCPERFTNREEYEAHYISEHENTDVLLREIAVMLRAHLAEDDAAPFLRRIEAILGKAEA